MMEKVCYSEIYLYSYTQAYGDKYQKNVILFLTIIRFRSIVSILTLDLSSQNLYNPYIRQGENF